MCVCGMGVCMGVCMGVGVYGCMCVYAYVFVCMWFGHMGEGCMGAWVYRWLKS